MPNGTFSAQQAAQFVDLRGAQGLQVVDGGRLDKLTCTSGHIATGRAQNDRCQLAIRPLGTPLAFQVGGGRSSNKLSISWLISYSQRNISYIKIIKHLAPLVSAYIKPCSEAGILL